MSFNYAYTASVLMDFFEAACLLALLFLFWPLAGLHILFKQKLWNNVKTLHAFGLLPNACHALIDYRLGHWELALSGLEGMISALEEPQSEKSADLTLKRSLLAQLYMLVVKLNLRRGLIEDGALAVVRAHKNHGFEHLDGLKDFDYKAAQIVKAAISASQLINDGGIAQVIVETTPAPTPTPKRKPKLQPLVGASSTGAKIIPFPANPS